MNLRLLAIVALLSASIGAGLVWRFKPAEVKTVTVEKIVKDVQVKTVTKERIKPSGEIVREVVTDSVSHFESDIKMLDKPNWYVALTTNRQLDEFSTVINRRLLGDFFLSVEITTKGRYGLGIGVEF